MPLRHPYGLTYPCPFSFRWPCVFIAVNQLIFLFRRHGKSFSGQKGMPWMKFVWFLELKYCTFLGERLLNSWVLIVCWPIVCRISTLRPKKKDGVRDAFKFLQIDEEFNIFEGDLWVLKSFFPFGLHGQWNSSHEPSSRDPKFWSDEILVKNY